MASTHSKSLPIALCGLAIAGVAAAAIVQRRRRSKPITLTVPVEPLTATAEAAPSVERAVSDESSSDDAKEPRAQSPSEVRALVEALHKLFASIDDVGLGYITKRQFAEFLNKLGLTVSSSVIFLQIST